MSVRDFLRDAGLLSSSPGEVARMRTAEGPRGYSTRAAVFVRYAVYVLTVVLCSSLSGVMLKASGTTSLGGPFTMGASTAVLFTAALGTALYPTQRQSIIDQMRHYLFGLMLFPSTGIAAVVWAVTSVAAGPTASPDVMIRTLNFSLPAIWACTLIIPLVIFIKVVAGVHTMHRSHLDDEEMVQLYTRMDSHQR